MGELLKQPEPWPVLRGGKSVLSASQRRVVSEVADVVRELPPEQSDALVWLIDELRRDGYLERLRTFDTPAIKILAEVISGWEPDGVYEFARAWVSTLVAREDGFSWSDCTPEEKEAHRRKVTIELIRRGVTPVKF